MKFARKVEPLKPSQRGVYTSILWLILPLSLSLGLLLGPSTVMAEWQDWFRTPEQRASKWLEEGDTEALIESAPSPSFKGHGHFQAGEHGEAVSAFEQAREIANENGDNEAAQRALYNTATSNLHDGNVDNAIRQYDELLELDPEHENALHNKGIAEKIREQQQQQQQQDDDQQGEQNPDGQPGEQQDGQSGKDGQSGDQKSESGDQSEQASDGSQNDESSSDGQNANADNSNVDEESQQANSHGDSEENSEAAGRAALDAEENAGGELSPPPSDAGENNDGESKAVAVQESDEPLTEQQQATEQWLRQIPDDPAGLLRNKLEQSHRLEYPGVQSSEERW